MSNVEETVFSAAGAEAGKSGALCPDLCLAWGSETAANRFGPKKKEKKKRLKKIHSREGFPQACRVSARVNVD